MQFIVSTKQLGAALKQVLPATATRSAFLPLTGVRIQADEDGVLLEATDLEAAAQVKIEGATVDKWGSVIVPAKPLAKALRVMGDEVAVETVEVDGKTRVAVNAGSRTVTLETFPEEDYPKLHDATTLVARANAHGLKGAFERAVLCASRDEARPSLISVALIFTAGSPVLEIISTDSYRMGVQTVTLGEAATQTVTLLVPSRVAKELAKQMHNVGGPVTISLNTETAGFAFGASSFWSTRLVDGELPNWRPLVPDESGGTFTFSTVQMASALKASEAVGTGDEGLVRLNLGKVTTLTCISDGIAVLRETLRASYDNGVGDIQITFNSAYLADALAFVGTETTTMRVRDAKKAVLIGASNHRRYVLMPVSEE
jgi:DNA polymerase-3 subunit beta